MSGPASTRRRAPDGYSAAQIAPHWLVVLLLAAQFLSSGGMEEFWRATRRGTGGPLADDTTALLHAVSGITVFVLVILRLVLRVRHGAPAEPADLHPLLRMGAKASHWALYALLLVLPFTGAGAVFGGRAAFGEIHSTLVPVLWALVVLHILAAVVFHGAIRRDGVLMRMMKPG